MGMLQEMPVLWITAGLGCDGDSVSITAATQPSLEDLVLGTIPGVPRLKLHHPILSPEVGDDFLEPFRNPPETFILVVEGSIPREAWAAGLGIDQDGQPIP